MRDGRRREIARALIRVLAAHGQAGVTVGAVAAEAGVAPGLVHHYFVDKQELYAVAMDTLVDEFRRRAAERGGSDALSAYADAALALDSNADLVAARAWVGLFAEALSDPALFQKLRRVLDAEVAAIQRRSGDAFSTDVASSVLSFVVGALVFGAFAPRRAAGFAAPALRRMLKSIDQTPSRARPPR
jgi:TetR/AcrR family transcriptional repressor of bet genes